jgi:hypothetical protein
MKAQACSPLQGLLCELLSKRAGAGPPTVLREGSHRDRGLLLERYMVSAPCLGWAALRVVLGGLGGSARADQEVRWDAQVLSKTFNL